MSKNFIFRDAAISDVDKIITPLNKEPMLQSIGGQEYSKRELEEIINDKEMNIVLIADNEKGMAGFIMGDLIKRRDFSYADFTAGYVFEEYRRFGLMKKLISSFEEKAKERGCVYVHGSIRIKNYNAQKCLKKTGYNFGNRFIHIPKYIGTE